MSIFANMKTEGLEEAQDRLGGFQVFDTDAYDATIKLAYAITSAGGAHGVVLTAELPGGKEYNETIYVTNRKGENFFLNKDDKTKKVPLPGFTTMDHICLAATEQPLSAQETEEKIVKVYDSETKSQLPKSVQVLTGLLGKPVTLGILKQLENKNEKDSAGNYQPTAETRDTNVIDKVFHTETKKTMVEALNGQDATFYEGWVAKNKGQTRDKRSIKDGQAGTSGRPSAGAPAAGAPATGNKPKSLFGGAS